MLVGVVLVAVGIGVALGRSIGDEDGSVAATASTTAPETTTTEADDDEDGPLSGQELAARYGAAVWEVEADACGDVWTGTAFAIDPNHLVTNHHVVVTDTRPTLISRTGDRIQGRVIGWSERPDVAIIETDALLPQWLEWAPTDELAEGQPLVVLGYPAPEGDFTVTPGTVLSFQVRDSQREAVRSDAAIDRGNSGGPALDTEGRVMGVVTEMAANAGGFQLVPLIFTHDAVSDVVDQILASPGQPEPDCSWSEWGSEPVPEAWEEVPETWESGAQTYGDHPLLDGLWDRCAEGEMGACDELWWMSPIGSEYETFGSTCGHRAEAGAWCDPSTSG